MQTKFEVLAVNDEKDFCECCGKSGLKCVVWIKNTETGEVKHFGSVCAAKPAKGFGVDAEIKKAVGGWKAKLKGFYMIAGRTYRAKGGKYVADKNEVGAYIAENISLWQQCFQEVKAKAQ